MFDRVLEKELLLAAKSYPVVTITGPRQSGKTTLAKATFKGKAYANLEVPDVLAFALEDPRGFLAQYPDGAILDEIQRAPQLLSYLQAIVDEQSQTGLFILTGSHQMALHQEISQSLAGRTAILNLLPLSLSELRQQQVNYSLEQKILLGGYPRIYQYNIPSDRFYRDYLQTYVERDVREIINVKDLNMFQRFVKLCATRIGQILDITSLSNDLGISRTAVSQWLSVLEASFLVFRLQPYFENFGKRIIKSPKLYFNDVGLACYLLGIEESIQLNSHPLRGNLFENLMILELYKTRLNQGGEPRLYYYRDNHQREIDVLYQTANQIIPIEIKSAQTFHVSFLKHLKFMQRILGDHFQKGYLIYTGQQQQEVNDFSVVNYVNAVDKIFT